MTDKLGIKYAAAVLLLIFAAGMLTSCNIFGSSGETIIMTDPVSEAVPDPETDPENDQVHLHLFAFEHRHIFRIIHRII